MLHLWKLILIFTFIFVIPGCYAVEEDLNILNKDYDGVKEEASETVTNTDDSQTHLDNKGYYLIKDEVDDNMEVEYNIFDKFNKTAVPQKQKSEEPLFAKIMKQDIVRTDMPIYLLKDYMTFKYDKGPIKKIHIYGAYNGRLNSFFENSDYDTNYNFGFTQIGMLGKLSDGYTDFKILMNPRPNKDLNYMQNFFADAYLVNNRIPHHKVIIGHSRNAIGYEGASSSYILPFAMRSQIARNFGSTRATGIKLIGDYSLIDYSLAFNSSDRFFHEFFPGTEFTGWINLKPLGKTDGKYGKLTIGGGINAGKNRTDYKVGGFYVGYKYKRLWTNFEYAIADGSNGSYVSDKKATGFYGTVGYKITPKVQLIGRYDQFDPDRNMANDLRREISAGINWFIKGQAIRVILNYVFCMNQNAPDSHRIILATQFLL